MGSNQTILLTRKSKSKYNLLEKLGDVAIMVTIAYRLVCQYCKLLILTSDKDYYQTMAGAAILIIVCHVVIQKINKPRYQGLQNMNSQNYFSK